MKKNFYKFIKSPAYLLNGFELILHLIIVFFLITFISILFALFFSSVSQAKFIGLFLSLESIFFWYSLAILSGKFLEKHFDMYDEDNPANNSFEGWIVSFLFYTFAFISFWLGLGYAFSVPIIGLGMALTFAYPGWILFSRRKNCFNEDSIENNGFGFIPKFYYFLGLFCGFFSIGFSFWSLQSSILIRSPPIFVSIDLIIFSLLWIYLVLSPDIWNRYLPLDIKERNGFFIYSVIAISISALIFIYLNLIL